MTTAHTVRHAKAKVGVTVLALLAAGASSALGLSACSSDGPAAARDAGVAVDAGATADSGTPADAGAEDTGVTGSPEERHAFERGGRTTTSVFGLLSVTDGLFAFDPTLDPRQSAPANAQRIRDNTTTNLSGCGSVVLQGTTVVVTADACTLQGVEVSGVITASVAKTAPTLAVTVTWTSLTVDGRTSTGSATFATSNGTTYQVSMHVNSSTDSTQLDVQLTGASTGITLDGTASVDEAGVVTQVRFNEVHYDPGDCYPDGGSMTVTVGRVSMTIIFSASTASTGQVSVMQGRLTYPDMLPTYGSCPSATTGDAGVSADAGLHDGGASSDRRDAGALRDGGGLARDR